jgi:penicillin V acylase-like amidase (Ntn superfamily)
MVENGCNTIVYVSSDEDLMLSRASDWYLHIAMNFILH